MDRDLFILFYVLGGFGLRGGFPHWNETVRAAYAVVFPLHELCFRAWDSGIVTSLFRSYWPWLFVVAVFLACAALSEFQ